MDLSLIRGLQDLFLGRGSISVGNIEEYSVVKEDCVLWNHPNGSPKAVCRDLIHPLPVNGHQARVRVVKPEQQLQDR